MSVVHHKTQPLQLASAFLRDGGIISAPPGQVCDLHGLTQAAAACSIITFPPLGDGTVMKSLEVNLLLLIWHCNDLHKIRDRSSSCR